MSEKERISGEQERQGPDVPVLPTVNPEAEKAQMAKASLHPAFYIAYVSRPVGGKRRDTAAGNDVNVVAQLVDLPLIVRHHLQQMDPRHG